MESFLAFFQSSLDVGDSCAAETMSTESQFGFIIPHLGLPLFLLYHESKKKKKKVCLFLPIAYKTHVVEMNPMDSGSGCMAPVADGFLRNSFDRCKVVLLMQDYVFNPVQSEEEENGERKLYKSWSLSSAETTVLHIVAVRATLK